ncbi:hypothetical protein [Streptomyces sp. bgisy084]|uniref:hypothetical protein n=1 Tax=Streptomyces sp. bgisy084 TaxID=3413777 RepID=UPI003D74790E
MKDAFLVIDPTAPPAFPVGDMANEPEPDPRFTTPLVLDVAEVLVRHGYPELTSGADLAALRMYLLRFCHIGR